MKKLMIFVLAAVIFATAASPLSAEHRVRRIALMLNNEIVDDDTDFNTVCIKGLEMAKNRYKKKITTKVYNAFVPGNDLASTLSKAASESDLVVIPEPAYLPFLKKTADEHRDVKFVTLDETDVKGVTKVVFRDEEGGFMAGALAALMTKRTETQRINKDGVIGIILGMDVPSIRRFQKGYIDGAWYIDKSVKVISENIDTFSDTVKGKDAALKLRDKGADVIFTVAGVAGLGAIESASRDGYWMIGVDSEQEARYPDDVLCSVVKRTNFAIFQIIGDYLKSSSSMAEMESIGVKEGVIDISTWTRESKRNLPGDVRDKMADIEDKLNKGLIVIK